MRYRLQQVLAYRQLQAAVRAGATHTLVNACIWLGLTFLIFQNAGPDPMLLAYLGLGVGELFVGIWKKAWPTLEAVLVDGLVSAAFALFILGRQFLAWQGIIAFPVNGLSIFLGVWVLYSAMNSFRAYKSLRDAFPDRPTSDVIAWFDELIDDINRSDPAADDLALDLPTKPRWKAKLLGSTAFFAARSGEVVVLGPWDFGITPVNRDGSDSHRVQLHILDRLFKPFDIDEASWSNYRKWMATHQQSQT